MLSFQFLLLSFIFNLPFHKGLYLLLCFFLHLFSELPLQPFFLLWHGFLKLPVAFLGNFIVKRFAHGFCPLFGSYGCFLFGNGLLRLLFLLSDALL